MTESERLPCPRCGEPVELHEPDCPRCGASLLVNVVLQGQPPDPRVRYRLARTLQVLPGAPALTAIQAGLVDDPPVVARAVTRAFAHEALPLLAQEGWRCRIERPVATASEGGSPLRLLLGAVAAIVLLAGVYVGWQRLLPRIEPTGPRLTDADMRATRERSPRAQPEQPVSQASAPAARSSRELAQSGLAATVSLRCSDSVGSGFFVSPDLVVTNAHVLCTNSDEILVTQSEGKKLVGRVVKKAQHIDLALVRVAYASARPLPLGDVGDVEVGDKVVIVGSPLGLDFTVHEGSVSSLRRSANHVAYLQLDAKLNPGNSGGPVIDPQGRVVGIVAMKLTGRGVEGIGLALPINYVYGAELAFVPAPSGGAASSPAFTRMVSAANRGGDALEEVSSGPPDRTAPEASDGPLLVGARVDQYGNLVLRIVRVTDVEPRFEEISVKVWSGMEVFCTMKSDIRDWKRGDANLAAAGMDPRTAKALREVSRGQTLFIGESPVRWDLCTRSKMQSGIEIELEGANPIANRLMLR
jgi:S1-C subfamily serine protease